MIERIENYIIKNNLIEDGENIIVGFSGGPDSVLLLYALNKLKAKHGYSLIAVHINHMIRDEEAKRDEEFAVDFSQSLGIRCITRSIPVIDIAKRDKISVEDAGRKVRYGTFNEILEEEFSKGIITVGHHKNDDAETIMLNLIRGAGTSGITGIINKNQNIVRPLLDISKKEIIEYLRENKLPFVEDKTNYEEDYVRNKIRNVLIPYIERELNPNFIDSLSRMATILSEEDKFLESYIKSLNLIQWDGKDIKIDISKFLDLSLAIQRRIILEAYGQLNGNKKDISFKNIQSIISIAKNGGGDFYLKDYMIYIASGYLYFIHLSKMISPKEMTIYEQGLYEFGNRLIDIQVIPKNNIDKDKNQEIFPIYLLNEGLSIRSRKNGDKIVLKGYSKKVKDIFIDEKLPKHLRDSVPIFQFRDDIIWIAGFRRSFKYMVNKEDEFVLKIRVEEKKDDK